MVDMLGRRKHKKERVIIKIEIHLEAEFPVPRIFFFQKFFAKFIKLGRR